MNKLTKAQAFLYGHVFDVKATGTSLEIYFKPSTEILIFRILPPPNISPLPPLEHPLPQKQPRPFRASYQSENMCRTVAETVVCSDCGGESRGPTMDQLCPSRDNCPERNRRPLPQVDSIVRVLCRKCWGGKASERKAIQAVGGSRARSAVNDSRIQTMRTNDSKSSTIKIRDTGPESSSKHQDTARRDQGRDDAHRMETIHEDFEKMNISKPANRDIHTDRTRRETSRDMLALVVRNDRNDGHRDSRSLRDNRGDTNRESRSVRDDRDHTTREDRAATRDNGNDVPQRSRTIVQDNWDGAPRESRARNNTNRESRAVVQDRRSETNRDSRNVVRDDRSATNRDSRALVRQDAPRDSRTVARQETHRESHTVVRQDTNRDSRALVRDNHGDSYRGGPAVIHNHVHQHIHNHNCNHHHAPTLYVPDGYDILLRKR